MAVAIPIFENQPANMAGIHAFWACQGLDGFGTAFAVQFGSAGITMICRP